MIRSSRERVARAQQSMQKVGVQALMLFLFLYFCFSGASELGIADSFPRRFTNPPWLGKIMGVAEMFGGLALLRTEGILGGAIVLAIVTACALVLSLVDLQAEAAMEYLLMFAICAYLIYWRRPEHWKTNIHKK